MTSSSTSIFMGYDNRLFYDALDTLISSKSSYHVTGGNENGPELLKRVKIQKPDVILIELEFPTKRSLEYLQRINLEFDNHKVVLISTICNNGNISAIIETGIVAFILKSCNREDLFNALDHVIEHKKYFCATVTQYLLKEYRNLRDSDKQLLTHREIQILQKLVNGNSNKWISNKLSISESTVKTHRKNIMNKFGANNLLSLVRFACRNNLIDFGKESFCTSCPYKQ